MQDVKKIVLNNRLEIIETPDLERTLRLKEAKRTKEEFEQFQQGEIALENSAYNEDDDSNIVNTGTGVVVNTNRSRNKYKTIHHEKDPNGVKALMEALANGAINIAFLKTLEATVVSALSHKFVEKSAQKLPNEDEPVTDFHFIYESEEVSRETARLLNNRILRIVRAQRELESISDPEVYALRKEALERLIDRSGLRQTPHGTLAYDLDKVLKIESKVDSNGLDCTGKVCAFRPKTQTHDSRGIKRLPGDQYDDNPVEKIGEVKQETARPVVPAHIPSFDIS